MISGDTQIRGNPRRDNGQPMPQTAPLQFHGCHKEQPDPVPFVSEYDQIGSG